MVAMNYTAPMTPPSTGAVLKYTNKYTIHDPKGSEKYYFTITHRVFSGYRQCIDANDQDM